MFGEMEAVCGTVATIGGCFEGTVVRRVGLINTYTALGAEITCGGVGHFRLNECQEGTQKIRYRCGIQFFNRARGPQIFSIVHV